MLITVVMCMEPFDIYPVDDAERGEIEIKFSENVHCLLWCCVHGHTPTSVTTLPQVVSVYFKSVYEITHTTSVSY